MSDEQKLQDIYMEMANKLCEMHPLLPKEDEVQKSYLHIHDACIAFCGVMVDYMNKYKKEMH